MTILFCLSAMVLAQSSQRYEPDTSLTYSTFLKQCQSFTKQVREEAWVVNFWDTSKPSLDSFTGLKEVYSEFRYNPIRFISISKSNNKSLWRNILAYPSIQPPWEQLMVGSGSDYDFLTKAFRHQSLPGIFVVNPQGQVQRVRDAAQLRTVLTPIARELPGRPYSPNGFVATKDIPEPEVMEEDFPDADVDSRNTTPASPQWLTHTVRKGETLYRLKIKYGVEVDEIKALNGLNSNSLAVGQVLKIKQR